MPIGVARVRAAFACLLLAVVIVSGCRRTSNTSAAPAIVRVTEVVPAGPARSSPISLTASDGSGLKLVQLLAETVVQAPIAFTELQLTFENPEDRVREGRFEIQLPPGANLSRFAMKIDGKWQEGEVVERKLATRAYEDFLHRRQDPALLEQAAGNSFSARVFPIPPRATKELILSYSQEVGRAHNVLVPLAGLPEIRKAEVRVWHGTESSGLQAISWEGRPPAGDIALDANGFGQGDAVRAGGVVVARVRVPIDPEPEAWKPVLLLVDTSASRALGIEEQTRLVEQLVQRIASQSPESTLGVACFDQQVDSIYQGRAAGFGAAELEKIRTRGALGASNLEQALRWAAAAAKDGKLERAVLLTDGVATAGSTDGKALMTAAAALRESGVQRIDAIVVGGIRDEAALRRLVTAGLAHDGVVIDGAGGLDSAFLKLEQRARGSVKVEVEGATWWWPRELQGVQAGDETIVYADLPEARPLVAVFDGKGVSVTQTHPAEQRLLARSWAKAKIDSLLDKEAQEGKSDALRDEIVSLSVKHRVLSPYTSLLVLETENDYQRYDIDRKALADILAIEDGRVARVERGQQPKIAADEPSDSKEGATGTRAKGEEGSMGDRTRTEADPGEDRRNALREAAEFGRVELEGVGESGGGRGEGIGLGSIGSTGGGAPAASGQGFGSGHGRLGGSHRTSPPRVTMVVTSQGSLPAEVVSRIIRQNYGRVRLCYEQGLRTDPTLAGTALYRIVIGADGTVTSVTDAGSRLGQRSVLTCIQTSLRGLTFPKPEKGTVTAQLQSRLSPGEGASTASNEAPAERREELPKVDPYDGDFAQVMRAIAERKYDDAIGLARQWQHKSPGDVLALTALGAALHAADDTRGAMRAYGALIDLYPFRADLRRFAGERLETLGTPEALDLAADTYGKAQEQRPDHPASHRLLAFALLKRQHYEKAFAALEAGAGRSYPSGRFAGVERILKEDLGLVAAAWMHAEPGRKDEIEKRLEKAGGTPESAPSLRFVLNWETDANDVDFHIYDAEGHHAYYSQKQLDDASELYADVTTGYGPECFTIRKPSKARSSEYKLFAHYYSRGPMGYGMGKLQLIEHDGRGGLTFEERPFVVMRDRAYVDLGLVKGKR